MDINFVIMGLFFTSAPSRPSVFHPPPLPTPASSVTHTRSEVEFVHCVHCVHFSPLLNLEPVFQVTRLLPLHRNFWAVGARERTISDKVKNYSYSCRLCVGFLIYIMFLFFILVCVISYIYNVPIFLLFMDSFCSFFVHVRLRSFRSMTSFFCPMSGSGLSDLWSVRISVRLFCVPFKGKKIRWPSLSFFRSCPAPVFRIYDPPPPWTVYSDHSCPVSHHLVLFPFEFRFVCFVSRSKVKKFDDQACPFFVHVRLRSFRSMHPPPPHPVSTILSVLYMRGWGREGSGRAMAHGWLRLVLWCS
jgi:hypothetical protein